MPLGATPCSHFTFISLTQEGEEALAASQDQGAEKEACEELHGAEMKGESQGDSGKGGTPAFGTRVSEGAWLCICIGAHGMLLVLAGTWQWDLSQSHGPHF